MSEKPSTRRYNRNQEAIVQQAREIIVEGGVEKLSMRTLADALDYSPSALYKYFDNKESLIGAVAHQGLQDLSEMLEAATVQAESYTDKALAAGRAYLQFAYKNPQLYLTMFNSPIYPTNAGAVAEAASDRAFMVMVNIFERGIAAGEFAQKPGYGAMEMAFHAWITVHGAVMLRSTGSAPLEFFDVTTDRVLQILVENMREMS